VIASAVPGSPAGDETFRLVPAFGVSALDGFAFYAGLLPRVVRQLRAFDPDVVVAESPYEGAIVLLARAVARRGARVVVEAHGDWQTSTRLYGSPARRLVAPLGDLLSEQAVRHADAVRALSPFTARLLRQRGIEPDAVFPTYSDLGAFAGPARPLPPRPQALFVGVLESYKNIRGLAEAWRRAAPHVPDARLVLVGEGSQTAIVRQLLADVPGRTEWLPRLDPAELARALDESWLLVLPSRAEGLGRVVIEAFLRGRPVLGARVGGIPDLVADGENGVLVDPLDAQAIADAFVALLGDRERVERLAAGTAAAAERWRSTPAEFADNVVALVEAALR
jgi:glycosyltransferase involved in cell wall biosynthesis